jgi:hypothetical protein
MLIKLHSQATTTRKIRAAIQASDEPAWIVADRHGTSKQTVWKWRKRDGAEDRSHTPHRLQTTLTPAQEAVAVALRKTLLVSLDDLLAVTPAWRRAWQEVIPFFAFDPAIRKIIYTTIAIESLNRVIRKSIKTRGSFPTEDAATKLIYLAIRNFEKGGRNVREWFAARNHFAIMFEERFNA